MKPKHHYFLLDMLIQYIVYNLLMMYQKPIQLDNNDMLSLYNFHLLDIYQIDNPHMHDYATTSVLLSCIYLQHMLTMVDMLR